MNKKITIAIIAVFILILILSAAYILMFWGFTDISAPIANTGEPAETTNSAVSEQTSQTSEITETETETETTTETAVETSAESEAHTDAHDNESWALFLVNKDNPLPPGYISDVELEPIYKDFMLDARCAGAARAMLEAAENDGVRLVVISAYRSEEKQADNFNDYVERLIREGMSEDEAIAVTALQIARPGESEHNAAVAIDILCENWYDENDDITEAFDLTPEYAWLKENSWKYGFILRYEKGKTDITGFDYEPWHYRYVGIERAKDIVESGLSLDEYIAN